MKISDSVETEYVLYGDDQPWFRDALSSFLQEKGLKYCQYGFESDTSGTKIYVNCSSEEIPESLVAGKVCLDLSFYMQLCYFDFPEFHIIKNRVKEKERDGIEGIITGMSYFRDAVGTDWLSHPAINAARSSEDLYYDLIELAAHFSKDIKWAVMGLAPYSLNYDEALSTVQNYRMCAYIHEYGKMALRGQEAYGGLVDLKNYISGYLGEDVFDYIFWNGYVPANKVEEYDMQAVFSASAVPIEEQLEVGKQYEKRYPDTISMNKGIIKEYVNFCKERGISLLIVIPPFSEWYKSCWNPEVIHELREFLSDLMSYCDFDLLDLSDEIWEDKYFRNGSHVNEIGRNAVSTIINGWIDSALEGRMAENSEPETENEQNNSELIELYRNICEHTLECAQKLMALKGRDLWEKQFLEAQEMLDASKEIISLSEKDVIEAYQRMESIQECCYRAYIELNSRETLMREKKESPFRGRGVVYTCVTGGYDEIKIPEYKDDSFDYVLLTDQRDFKSDFWTVRYIDNPDNLSKVKLARKNKILAHEMFDEYDFSIYIDGKVQIVGDMKEFIEKYSRGSGMLCFPHFLKNSLDEELDDLIRMGKDKTEVMQKQVFGYLSEGFPMHYGMTDTCVLIRNHKDTQLRKVMETWWDELYRGSHRDQLSFSYSCWKNNYVYDCCDLLVMDNPYVFAGGH